MDLIALEPERVKFAGLGERSGLMTLGQLNIFEWISGSGVPVDARLDWVLDLPDNTLVSDVTESLAVMLARHEGLRSSYLATDPPVQLAAGEGELVIDVFAVDGEPGAADRRALTLELLERLRAADGPESEALPVQVALVRHGDKVLVAAALCSHLAVDLHAAGLLAAEFAELVRDPSARADGPVRRQPLDRARAEQRPQEGRRRAAAIGHWEHQLARMPKHVYGGPRRAKDADGGDDGYGESAAVVITSAAAEAALDRIAERTRQSRVATVFAAVCLVLSQRTGYERWSAPLMSGNRFEPSLMDYVGTLAQSAAVDIDVRGAGFDAAIGRVAAATFTAYRHGVYDVYERRAAERRVGGGRGIDFCLEPLFNGVDAGPATQGPDSGASAQRPGADAPTRIERVRMPPTGTLIRFDMRPAPGALKLQCWTGDTARTPCTDMEALLLGVERLLVAAATQDLDADQMRRVTGIEPLARGDDWMLIDHCWVELSEARRLLEDALPSVAPRFFPTLDGRALVAYVPAGPHARTPEQAHARCMAQLPGRASAMTPRWYVMCDGVPDDADDANAWRRLGVLAEGSGRV